MSNLLDARGAAKQVRSADRWISRMAAGTVAGLAGVAGALSYSHMRQLAYDHGQLGWHAHAFPLSVDGVEIVASLVLLADRRAGRRPGWLPWTALAAGTAGSLAANIAAAHPDPVSRIIAGWPALALVLAVKLLVGILERPSLPDTGSIAADQASQASAQSSSVTGETTLTGLLQLSSDPRPAKILPRPTEPRDSQPSSSFPADHPGLGGRQTELLLAARVARDELRQDGLPLTRDALASRLRERGHPIRNASITPLLRQLRHEQPTQLAA